MKTLDQLESDLARLTARVEVMEATKQRQRAAAKNCDTSTGCIAPECSRSDHPDECAEYGNPASPPDLPPQWRWEPDNDTWSKTPGSTLYDCGDGEWLRYRQVVPAQPRPADCTDADGVTWTAGKYASPDECVRVGTWFCCGQLDTTRTGGTPYRGEHNGWRWTAVPVKKQEPEVRRFGGRVWNYENGQHPIYEYAPLMQKGLGDPVLDRAAIAREEVIREFRDILERTANGPNRAVEYLAIRLSELRGER